MDGFGFGGFSSPDVASIIRQREQQAARDEQARLAAEELKKQQEPGAFMSAMEWLNRPFQVVANTIGGLTSGDSSRFASAGKQGVDFISDIADAFLPGDVLPNMVDRSKDTYETSDILGDITNSNPNTWNPWVRTPIDIAGSILLDPTSYLTFGATGAAKGAVKAVQSIDKLSDVVRATAITRFDDILAILGKTPDDFLRASRQSPKELVEGLRSQKNLANDLLDAGIDQARVTQFQDMLAGIGGVGENAGRRIGAARDYLSRSMTRQGRRAFKEAEMARKAGGEALSPVDDILRQATVNGDVDTTKLYSLVKDNPLFNQGGVSTLIGERTIIDGEKLWNPAAKVIDSVMGSKFMTSIRDAKLLTLGQKPLTIGSSLRDSWIKTKAFLGVLDADVAGQELLNSWRIRGDMSFKSSLGVLEDVAKGITKDESFIINAINTGNYWDSAGELRKLFPDDMVKLGDLNNTEYVKGLAELAVAKLSQEGIDGAIKWNAKGFAPDVDRIVDVLTKVKKFNNQKLEEMISEGAFRKQKVWKTKDGLQATATEKAKAMAGWKEGQQQLTGYAKRVQGDMAKLSKKVAERESFVRGAVKTMGSYVGDLGRLSEGVSSLNTAISDSARVVSDITSALPDIARAGAASKSVDAAVKRAMDLASKFANSKEEMLQVITDSSSNADVVSGMIKALDTEDIASIADKIPSIVGPRGGTGKALRAFESMQNKLSKSIGAGKQLERSISALDDIVAAIPEGLAGVDAKRILNQELGKLKALRKTARKFDSIRKSAIGNSLGVRDRILKVQETIKDMGDDLLELSSKSDIAAELLKDNASFQKHLRNIGWSVSDYTGESYLLPRMWDANGDAARILASRKLESFEEIAQYMKRTGAKVEPDVQKTLIRQAEDVRRSVVRGNIARTILGPDAVASEVGESMKTFMQIAESTDPAFAKLMSGMVERTEPGVLIKLLHKVNSIFKPAAVFGVGMPRFGTILVRNTLGGGTSQALEAGARHAARNVSEWPMIAAQSVSDWITTLMGRPPKYLTKVRPELEAVADAYRYGGNIEGVLQRLEGHKYAKEMVELGVLDDWVGGEQLYSKLKGAGPLPESWNRVLFEAPQASFQAGEQHMRYGMYVALREEGYTAKAAAKTVGDAFFDYRIMTPENFEARQLIPFMAFTSNAVRQQGKLIAKMPWYRAAVGGAYRQDYEEGKFVDPSIVERGGISLGGDSYLAGLGLPVEALNIIPDSGSIPEFLRKDVLGASNPLIKNAVGYATNVDTFFGGPYGAYDRTPALLSALGAPEEGSFGRAWNNLRGSGVGMPLTSPVDTISQLFDQRKSAGENITKFLTGARIETNDTNAGLRRLRTVAAMDPDVGVAGGYYARNDEGSGLAALLNVLGREQQAERKKAKEAASQ